MDVSRMKFAELETSNLTLAGWSLTPAGSTLHSFDLTLRILLKTKKLREVKYDILFMLQGRQQKKIIGCLKGGQLRIFNLKQEN